jgi:hypothetical protein
MSKTIVEPVPNDSEMEIGEGFSIQELEPRLEMAFECCGAPGHAS